jgi:four helix bundle protein
MALGDESSSNVLSFRDLIAWQKSIALAGRVYEVTHDLPKEETFGLKSQTRRAAVSVASNVAEGHARASSGEFIQFLGHAKGSLAELETQAIIAGQLDLLSAPANR